MRLPRGSAGKYIGRILAIFAMAGILVVVVARGTTPGTQGKFDHISQRVRSLAGRLVLRFLPTTDSKKMAAAKSAGQVKGATDDSSGSVLGESLGNEQLVFRIATQFRDLVTAQDIEAAKITVASLSAQLIETDEFSATVLTSEELNTQLANVGQDLTVQGATVLSGTLDVEGLTSLNDALEVAGQSTLSGPVTLGSTLRLGGNVTGSGVTIDVGSGKVLASNLVYSLQGQTGEVELVEGTGIAIDGLTITNTDLGTEQNIFKKLAVASQTTVEADANIDTLTLAAGSGISVATDATTDTITFSASGSDLNVSGFEDLGTTVALQTTTDNVGIGTTTATSKLHVVGDMYLDGDLSVTGNTTVLSGFNNSGGGITNAGAITGATGFTSSGTITLSALSTGVVQSNFSGILSSGALNLGGGASYITGSLPTTNGGTAIATYTTGDILYASAANTLSKLPIGGDGEVLTVASGIPEWSTVGGSGPCPTCLVNNPGSTQTITPSAATATGLSIRQASSGSVDIFNVTNSDGSVKYLRVDSSGNVQLGTNGATTTGNFTVSPTSTDPIAIAPVAMGASAYTGTITSSDLTNDRTWTFPDSSGTVCLTSGNCTGSSAGLGGSGSTNYLAKWSGTYTLASSVLYDTGTNVGIGTTVPTSKLHVVGGGYFSTGLTTDGAFVGNDTFDVGGAATFGSTLWVEGTADLNSTLGVTGATTLSSTLNVTGLTTLGGNLDVNGTGNSYVMGNWGIGTSSPLTKLHIMGSGTAVNNSGNLPQDALIEGASTAITATTANLQLISNSAIAADTGGSLGFGAKYSGNSYAQLATIKAGKTNSSSGDYSGYLAFATRLTGGNPLERMRIDNNGNVGIGTNLPVGLFNLNGAATGKALAILNQTGDQAIFVASVSGVNKFTIDNSGNVGIGTSSPSTFKLQIAGDIGPTTNNTYAIGSGSYRFSAAYLGPGGVSMGSSGDQGAITYDTTNDLMKFQSSTDSITGFQFMDSDGGTPIINIDTADERVGIGTAAPGAPLDVLGNVKITNQQVAGITAGTASTIYTGGPNTKGLVIKGTDYVANTFAPNSISGLTQWYKADSLSLNDGDQVSSWTDSSGYGYHASQASSSLRPLYKTNILNGYPTVRFDSSNDYLGFNNFPADPATLFVVYDLNSTVAGERGVVTAANGSYSGTTGWYYKDSTKACPRGKWGTSSGSCYNDAGLFTTATKIVAMSFTSGGDNPSVYYDGTLISRDFADGWGPITIQDARIGEVLDGDIAEIIVYNSALSSTDREKIEGYLAHKYGLTANLPVAHPYKSSSPTGTNTTTQSANLFELQNDAGTALSAFTSSGNLGIGTTDTSSFMLQVAGSVGPNADSSYSLGSLTKAWANIYGDAIYQNGNLVCDSSGANCPAGVTYWSLASGALSVSNPTLDVLIGSSATTSAKFAFKNVNSGTPTASISASSGNIATYLTGNGTLATTNRQPLTIGNSSTYNTTGDVLLNSNGVGNVGIGTTAPVGLFNLTGAATGKALAILNQTGDQAIFAASVSGTNKFIIDNSGNVGIGTSSPIARMQAYNASNTSGVSGIAGQSYTINSTALGTFGTSVKVGMVGSAYYNNAAQLSSNPLGSAYTSAGVVGIGAGTSGAAYGIGVAGFGQAVSTFTSGVFGGKFQADTAGDLNAGDTLYGVHSRAYGTTNTAGSDTVYGVYSVATGQGTDTTYGGYFSASGGGTNYGIYAAAGQNYFADNVGIGAVATQKLHVDAGNILINHAAATSYGIQFADGGSTYSLFSNSNLNALVLNYGAVGSTSYGIVLNSSGNVGIGTSSPVGLLQVSGKATGKALGIFNETGDQNILAASASGTTVATLDRSGNLAVEGQLSDLGGTTLTVNDDLRALGALSITGSAGFDGAVTLGNATNDSITFTGRAASSLVPGTSATYDLGSSSLRWNNVYAAASVALPNTGLLRFGTNGDCTNDFCLDDSGIDTPFNYTITNHNTGSLFLMPDSNVGIGTTTTAAMLDVYEDAASGYAAKFFNDGNNANRNGVLIQAGLDDHTAAGPSTLVQFNDGNGGAVGSITFGSSLTAYNTTSDQRAKQNITPSTMGIAQLMNIKIRDFSFIADSSNKIHTGFIAQELYDVFPDAVTPFTDGRYWQVDYGKVTPLIIKSVQDQQQQIALLQQQQIAFNADGFLTSEDQAQVLGAVDELSENVTGISLLVQTLQQGFDSVLTDVAWLKSAVANLQQLFTFSSNTVTVTKDVMFSGREESADSDRAGWVVVPAGQTAAAVKFDKPYKQRPVITATPEGATEGYHLEAVSENGFTLVLKQPLGSDVTFNWTAILVKDARTIKEGASSGGAGQSAPGTGNSGSDTPAVSPTPNASAAASPAPSPSVVPSPSPTASPDASTAPTPEASPQPSVAPTP